MALFTQHHSVRKTVLFLTETILIFISITLASYFRLYGIWERVIRIHHVFLKIALITGITQMCLYYSELYDFKVIRNSRELSFRLIQAIGATSILLGLLYAFLPQLIISRGIFLISIVIIFILVVSWRLLYGWVLRRGRFSERVLIIGTGELANKIIQELSERMYSGFRIIGLLVENPKSFDPKSSHIPLLGSYQDSGRIIKEYEIDRIVLALSERRGKLPISTLLEYSIKGVQIESGPNFYEQIAGKILIAGLRPSDLIFADGFRKSDTARFIKRMTGIFFSSLYLLLSAPVSLLAMLLIKLDSPGPIFFKQERVGEGGKVFNLYKFRSMKQNAETGGIPVWAKDVDPRVTRAGRILRKLRIDETPQMINVLKGNMSFVGPRPERPYFVERLKKEIPFYALRHSVKPGITGLAQIKYPYGATVEDAIEKLQYDLYYVKHMCSALDFAILFDTVKVVLFGKGAR
ncbi:MAG: TIGR03013 family PEP-CTERM/XrtA system glycosyltransferase [Nitrospirae bacterium]|nr:TIGR03013 family PEP-CTERM/XrtA system glycosyltransferase [Nitrospirota bacterium]